jgi:hypothetical protein
MEKYQRIAILVEFKMDVPFLQGKQNKYQWPFQFKHLNCRYLPPKYGLIWYSTSKKQKTSVFWVAMVLSWYIPPLKQFELDIHSNFKFTHSKSHSEWSFLAPGAGKELV